MSRSLAQASHRVITALDGMSALSTLGSDGPIDLLPADIIMPKGQPHGLALARKARQKRSDLAVIFMTGHRELRDHVGEDKVPFKPIEAERMLDEIADRLGEMRR